MLVLVVVEFCGTIEGNKVYFSRVTLITKMNDETIHVSKFLG